MQFLLDFFPLVLFLGAYLQFGDLYLALKVLMVAMPVAFLIKWRMTGKIDKMVLGSTALLLVMGTATLVFHNPMFLFWKPTVFYWAVAVAFLGSQFIGQKTFVERLFGTIGQVPKRVWAPLNIAWVLFFIASGFLNLYVAFNFSEEFWVKFKVFGFTAITFVFIMLQMFWLLRHVEKDPADQQETE